MLRAWESAALVVGVALLLAAPMPSPSADPEPVAKAAFEVADWYRVLVRDNVLGLAAEGVLVVTGIQGGTVQLGYSSESLHPLLLNYDLFPTSIDAPSLTYELGQEPFQPVEFPLERGRTWTTNLDGHEVTALVTDVSGSEAWISYRHDNGVPMAEGLYDTEVDWFRLFSRGHDGRQYRVTAELIAQGSGYSCPAVRPSGSNVIDLVHNGARRPIQTFEVPPDATHISLAMLASAGRAPARQQILAPDGAVYEASALPGEAPQSLLLVKTSPAGQWAVMSEAWEGTLVSSARYFAALPVELGPPGVGNGCYQAALSPSSIPETATANVGESWTLRALAVSVLGAIRWRSRIFWGTAALFSRLDRESAADQPARRRIMELLETHDSLQMNEIRQQLGFAWGTVVHHLSVLQRHGLVARTHLKGRVYWSRPGRPVAARPGPTAARILEEVRRQPGIGPSRLAQELGLRHSTVIYHAQRLAENGALRMEGQARRRRYFIAE